MKVRYLVTLIFMFFLTGCATVVTELKDPTGRLIPSPHYYYQIIGYPIEVVFYYTAFEESTDLDGSIIQRPTYLSMHEEHKIDTSKYKTITFTVEVNNPQKIEYYLYFSQLLIIGDSEDRMNIHSGGELNSSNMSYRQFTYKLPYEPDLREVDYSASLQIDSHEVLRFGNFHYTLNSGGRGVVEDGK